MRSHNVLKAVSVYESVKAVLIAVAADNSYDVAVLGINSAGNAAYPLQAPHNDCQLQSSQGGDKAAA